MTPRLLEFTISHFCERARWGLDALGVPFERKVIVPGPHVLQLRRLGLPGTTVPVLLTEGGAIQGSSAILDWAAATSGNRALEPDAADADACRELEATLERVAGADLRRILYLPLLDHPDLVRTLWCQDGPRWAPAFYRVAMGAMVVGLRKSYGITPDRVARSTARLDELADDLDARLARGPWLLGDRFTRADLTAASLLAPLCRPSDHLVRWPDPAPPNVDALEARYRDRPFYQWVRRTYRDRRNEPLSG